MNSGISQLIGVEESMLGSRYISNQKTKSLGKEDFLQLLITQLRYQDPLNPLESVEFTAQLAQFSSLEQLFNIKDGINELASSQTNNRKIEALSMMGKYVEAEGELLSIDKDKTGTGGFIIDEPAVCEVYIYSMDGQLIRRIDLGPLKEGEHEFRWDGRDNNGEMVEPGTYSFQVNAENIDGKSVNVDTRIKGMVTGINFEGEQPEIFIENIPVKLSQILEVTENNNYSVYENSSSSNIEEEV